MSTQNKLGDIVSGTLIKFPGDNVIYVVGEIFANGYCKLYDANTHKYKNKYTIAEIKAYVR